MHKEIFKTKDTFQKKDKENKLISIQESAE